MARTYRIIEPLRKGQISPTSITFDGFDRNYVGADFVAMFSIEGEVEIWALDDKSAISALLTYYQYMEFDYNLIGIFAKEKEICHSIVQ